MKKMKRRGGGGARPGAGRKPFAPTDKERDQVGRLSQKERVPYRQIASQVRNGISLPTLTRYFRDELIPTKVGNKPFNPTDDERRLVEKLAAMGLRRWILLPC